MTPVRLAARVAAATALTVLATCAAWVLVDVLRGMRQA